jgi:hypothetical protein
MHMYVSRRGHTRTYRERCEDVIDPADKSEGLQLPREGCRVWRYDSRPECNVARRV